MGLLQARLAWPVHLRHTTGAVCQSGRLSRHLKILCRRGGHSLGLQREGGYLRRLDSLLQTAFPQPIRREAIGLGDTASSPPEMLNWSGRLRADRFGRSSSVQAACEARTKLICLCDARTTTASGLISHVGPIRKAVEQGTPMSLAKAACSTRDRVWWHPPTRTSPRFCI